MARKFLNNQSSNKRQGGSFSKSPSRDNKIQKDTKKDNVKPNTSTQKAQTSNPLGSSQKSFPPPPPPVPSKPLTDAAKSNLAKLSSINKLMGSLTKPVIK